MSDQKHQQTILPFQTRTILFDLDDTLHHRYHAFQGWAQAFAQTYYAPKQSTEIADSTVHFFAEHLPLLNASHAFTLTQTAN